MINRTEEWLGRMFEARNPGPPVRIGVWHMSKEMGWSFEFLEVTDPVSLAERIEAHVQDAGFGRSYEFRAIDKDGRIVGVLQHRVQTSSLARADGPVHAAGVSDMSVPAAVADTIKSALQSSKAFAEVGLQSAKQSSDAADRLLARLLEQNRALAQENELLRQRAAAQWVLLNRAQTAEIELTQERV